jgi:hypothetical protein
MTAASIDAAARLAATKVLHGRLTPAIAGARARRHRNASASAERHVRAIGKPITHPASMMPAGGHAADRSFSARGEKHPRQRSNQRRHDTPITEKSMDDGGPMPVPE